MVRLAQEEPGSCLVGLVMGLALVVVGVLMMIVVPAVVAASVSV